VVTCVNNNGVYFFEICMLYDVLDLAFIVPEISTFIRTDRARSNPTINPDQEYIYMYILEKLLSTCYICTFYRI